MSLLPSQTYSKNFLRISSHLHQSNVPCAIQLCFEAGIHPSQEDKKTKKRFHFLGLPQTHLYF